MDIQNVSYHIIQYYSFIKKWCIDICHNVDEPWKDHAKRKKTVTKDYILYNFFPMDCPEYANL